MSYYAVATFGSPNIRLASYYRSLDKAREAAAAARGTGSCTNARVYECDSQKLARTVDISEIRWGERVVYEA